MFLLKGEMLMCNKKEFKNEDGTTRAYFQSSVLDKENATLTNVSSDKPMTVEDFAKGQPVRVYINKKGNLTVVVV